MYRMPENSQEVERFWTALEGDFCQYANHLPNHLLSIELKSPDFFLPLFVSFVSFYIILCNLSSFTGIFAFKKKKTSRKRCVYNHGNSHLFHFTSLTLICKLLFIRRISLEKKRPILNSQMITFWGTLFILAITIL